MVRVFQLPSPHGCLPFNIRLLRQFVNRGDNAGLRREEVDEHVNVDLRGNKVDEDDVELKKEVNKRVNVDLGKKKDDEEVSFELKMEEVDDGAKVDLRWKKIAEVNVELREEEIDEEVNVELRKEEVDEGVNVGLVMNGEEVSSELRKEEVDKRVNVGLGMNGEEVSVELRKEEVDEGVNDGLKMIGEEVSVELRKEEVDEGVNDGLGMNGEELNVELRKEEFDEGGKLDFARKEINEEVNIELRREEVDGCVKVELRTEIDGVLKAGLKRKKVDGTDNVELRREEVEEVFNAELRRKKVGEKVNVELRKKEVEEGPEFDKDPLCYDMTGDKFIIVLNQHTFENTTYFPKQPTTRNHTDKDESRLLQVFSEFGFSFIVKRDKTYLEIIDFVTSFAGMDHTKTSCVCVTILTHGNTGGRIYAADRPYQLSEIMAILGNVPSLVNKPKLFFVQACRGNDTDAGHKVLSSTQCDSVLTAPTYCSSEKPACCSTSSSFDYADAPSSLGWPRLLDLFKACGCFWVDAGGTEASRFGSPNVNILTVPSHADTLVLRSTVEGYLSYRDENGSWMIQALCDTIEMHHKDQDLLNMIIKMNGTVAEKNSRSIYCVLDNKKQMPETRFTLTKRLKFHSVWCRKRREID